VTVAHHTADPWADLDHDWFAFSVPGGEDAPAEATRRLTASLEPNVDPGVLETTRLLLGEMVGNCVRERGARAGDTIEVAGSLLPGVLRVEAISSRQAPLRGADQGASGFDRLDALADRWGVVDAIGGSVLWFELAT
jgi:hypothetical protein